ncbi:uncharacterized protein AAGF69_005276 isoform 1-T1 [Amazona ochrocephala]
MAVAAPRSRAGRRAGCSWPQPGVRAPAPVPPVRRFDAAWRRAGSGSRQRRQQCQWRAAWETGTCKHTFLGYLQTGSSADPAGCVEPTEIQAVLNVPALCLKVPRQVCDLH